MYTIQQSVFCCVVLFLVLSQYGKAFPLQAMEEPSFCRGLECPEYKVVMTTEDFEERCYEEYKWASTDMSGVDYSEAVRTGFERLFAYISGANKPKVKIEMTAPVATEIKAGPGPFCASNFTENFFVPFKYQSSQPPEPTGKVYIRTFPKHCQYVTTYPGFSNTTLIEKNVVRLVKALEKKGLGDSYYTSSYFFAGYDSPYELFHRHNEIWLIKKDTNNLIKA